MPPPAAPDGELKLTVPATGWDVPSDATIERRCDSDFAACCAFTTKTTLCTILQTPVPLNPTCNASSVCATPVFSWTAVANASGYALEVYTNASCSGSLAYQATLTANTTSWTLPGQLPEGVTCSWRIKAIGDNICYYCDSPFYTCCPFTVSSTPQTAIGLLEPPNGAVNQPLNPYLSWTPSPDATYYTVEIYTGSCSGMPQVSQNVYATEGVLSSSLGWGATYYWDIKGITGAGCAGATSDCGWFTTGAAYCP